MALVKANTTCALRRLADPAEQFRQNPETTIEVAVVRAGRFDT